MRVLDRGVDGMKPKRLREQSGRKPAQTLSPQCRSLLLSIVRNDFACRPSLSPAFVCIPTSSPCSIGAGFTRWRSVCVPKRTRTCRKLIFKVGLESARLGPLHVQRSTLADAQWATVGSQHSFGTREAFIEAVRSTALPFAVSRAGAAKTRRKVYVRCKKILADSESSSPEASSCLIATMFADSYCGWKVTASVDGDGPTSVFTICEGSHLKHSHAPTAKRRRAKKQVDVDSSSE